MPPALGEGPAADPSAGGWGTSGWRRPASLTAPGGLSGPGGAAPPAGPASFQRPAPGGMAHDVAGARATGALPPRAGLGAPGRVIAAPADGHVGVGRVRVRRDVAAAPGAAPGHELAGVERAPEAA